MDGRLSITFLFSLISTIFTFLYSHLDELYLNGFIYVCAEALILRPTLTVTKISPRIHHTSTRQDSGLLIRRLYSQYLLPLNIVPLHRLFFPILHLLPPLFQQSPIQGYQTLSFYPRTQMRAELRQCCMECSTRHLLQQLALRR